MRRIFLIAVCLLGAAPPALAGDEGEGWSFSWDKDPGEEAYFGYAFNSESSHLTFSCMPYSGEVEMLIAETSEELRKTPKIKAALTAGAAKLEVDGEVGPRDSRFKGTFEGLDFFGKLAAAKKLDIVIGPWKEPLSVSKVGGPAASFVKTCAKKAGVTPVPKAILEEEWRFLPPGKGDGETLARLNYVLFKSNRPGRPELGASFSFSCEPRSGRMSVSSDDVDVSGMSEKVLMGEKTGATLVAGGAKLQAKGSVSQDDGGAHFLAENVDGAALLNALAGAKSVDLVVGPWKRSLPLATLADRASLFAKACAKP
jgi:hypothetical protein